MTVRIRLDFTEKHGMFTMGKSMRETNKEGRLNGQLSQRKGGYCWRPTGIWAAICINTELLKIEKLKVMGRIKTPQTS